MAENNRMHQPITKPQPRRRLKSGRREQEMGNLYTAVLDYLAVDTEVERQTQKIMQEIDAKIRMSELEEKLNAIIVASGN